MNSGKRFENNFKNSVPKDIFYYRFRDGSSSWGGNEKVRFQQTNICDCMLFDGKVLYLLELKSTKQKSLPFNNIKKHQIEDLLKAKKYSQIICGLIIEFSGLNECYFVEIKQFKGFYDNADRKSLPIDYCRKNGIKIDLEMKKINKKLDIKSMIEKIEKEDKK